MNNKELIEQLQIINSVFQHPIDQSEDTENSVVKNPLLKTTLLPHQRRMVQAMHTYQHTMREGGLHVTNGDTHHLKGKIGVVADAPGSGKTLSVLAFLATPPSLHRTSECSMDSNRFFFSHIVQPAIDASCVSLVIVPPHLLQQWRNETATHTNMVPFVIDNRRLLRNRTTLESIRRSAFVLTTSKLYKDTYEYLATQSIRIHVGARGGVFDLVPMSSSIIKRTNSQLAADADTRPSSKRSMINDAVLMYHASPARIF
jgi:SNF2 family DNA or RNA helicase